LEVCLHAKFILSSLSTLLSEKEIDQLLQLTVEEADSFLKALEIGITAKDRQVKCYDVCSFSVTEALKILTNLSSNVKNCENIVRSIAIPSFVALLISGSTTEQKAVCQLIWKVLRTPSIGPKFKEQLISSELSIEDCVTSLQESEDEELVMLSDAVLLSMDTALNEGKIKIPAYCMGHIYNPSARPNP
jgi:hypothetical protein